MRSAARATWSQSKRKQQQQGCLLQEVIARKDRPRCDKISFFLKLTPKSSMHNCLDWQFTIRWSLTRLCKTWKVTEWVAEWYKIKERTKKWNYGADVNHWKRRKKTEPDWILSQVSVGGKKENQEAHMGVSVLENQKWLIFAVTTSKKYSTGGTSNRFTACSPDRHWIPAIIKVPACPSVL